MPIETARLRDVITRWRRDADGQPKAAESQLFATAGHVLDMRTAWELLRERLKLADLHWHDLRATYATRLLMEGTLMSQVRDLLGHSTIAVTERYDRMAKETLREGPKKLEQFITNLTHERKRRESQAA